MGDIQPQQQETVAPLRAQDEPHAVRHQRIEDAPNDGEEPARRRKAGFVQSMEEVHAVAGEVADERPCAERGGFQRDERAPSGLFALLRQSYRLL